MKLKILFVDEDQDALAGFRTMLHAKRNKWKAAFASSSEQALELLRTKHFDMVMADVRLPGMDGADLLKEAETLQPETVRIILTGYSEMQALLKSVKHAHQFITKPCNSTVITDTIERMANLRHILMDESARTMVTRLDSLPSMPELFVRIKNELESQDPDLSKVARLVEQDIGLSASLMKLVNSTFFGFYDEISSPSRAVVLLGVEALKGLVLGTHFFKQLDLKKLSGYSVEKLWSHSLRTGMYAKTIAAMESDSKEFVDNCFVAGFLHDIGKLIFISQEQDIYLPVLEGVRKSGGPILDVEKRQLGVTHAEIGAYLLGLWGFKEDVVKGVYGHHTLDRCGKKFGTALVVHVADALQHELSPSKGGYVFPKMNTRCIEDLNLQDRLELWRSKCEESMEDKDG